MTVRRKVIVIGGGVGGMSAAHELARRGAFDVVVYEQRGIAGGKARSVPAKPGTGARRPLPGEHGFRFFPGFYKHLPNTMSHILYAGQRVGVLDNLVIATEVQIAQEGGQGRSGGRGLGSAQGLPQR
jgi:15-cis-phytoene desaturase